MNIVEQARAYERSYHEDLYGNHGLFEPGTWLYRPAAYAIKSFDLVPKQEHVRVLDLGGGVGRHSIPAAKYFGVNSEVVCVDLLDSAIGKLNLNAKAHGVDKNIVGAASDVEAYELGNRPYDLILSISCIEHVPTKKRLEELITRLQAATATGGIHCFMMIANNVWVDSSSGETLAPLIEQNLSSQETIEMLDRLYAGWKIYDQSTKDWQATQPIDGKETILKNTCVQLTAQNLNLNSSTHRAMTERVESNSMQQVRNSKSRTNGCPTPKAHICYLTWQGLEVENQTIDDRLDAIDIQEIRELLD